MCDHIKDGRQGHRAFAQRALGLHAQLCPVAGGRVFLCVGTRVNAGVYVGVSVGVCVCVRVSVCLCEEHTSYCMSSPGPGTD